MKKAYIVASTLLFLTACSNDDVAYVEEQVAAQITASIGGSAETRAGDTSWTPGDEIGISMEGRYTNMKYTTAAGDGAFAGTAMYFKNKKDPVTLTAYYPFAGAEETAPSTGGVIKVATDAASQTSVNQPEIDFLYAKKENVTGENPKVKFEFSHKMSKLTLIFSDVNDGTYVNKITSYEISGLALEGEFDTATGVCSVTDGATPGTLAFTVTEGTVENDKPLPSVIIFPQEAARGSVTLKVTDSDRQQYSCQLNFKDDRLDAGNNYQWKITVNKTSLVVDKSTITDWNNQLQSTSADSVLQ